MKKLLLIVTLVIGTILWAEKVQILGTPNIRVEPSSKASKVSTNFIYDVTAIYGDYATVRVTEGKDKGKIGVMWTGVIPVQKVGVEVGKIYTVSGKGAAIRDKRGGTIIGGAEVSSKVEVIKIDDITWYKTILGWSYKSSVKVIK